MTWLSTWPADGVSHYAEHDTEAQAEAYATEIVRSKRAIVATAFWSEGALPPQTHSEAPRSAAGVEMAPENHTVVVRPNWNDPTIEGAA